MYQFVLSGHNTNMSYLREKENMNNLYEFFFFFNFLLVLDQGLLTSRSLHRFLFRRRGGFPAG